MGLPLVMLSRAAIAAAPGQLSRLGKGLNHMPDHCGSSCRSLILHLSPQKVPATKRIVDFFALDFYNCPKVITLYNVLLKECIL